MAPSLVLDVKNGDRGGRGLSYMYYAYILASPPFACSTFKSLTSHSIYPPPSPTILPPLDYSDQRATQADICTYTSPYLITKREIELKDQVTAVS